MSRPKDENISDKLAVHSSDTDGSQEANYTPIRVLGRGAFGEAILYRRIEVRIQLYNIFIVFIY